MKPGAWIQTLEIGLPVYSDDGTLPAGSLLTQFDETLGACAERAGKPFSSCFDDMEKGLEAAGFTNLQKIDYKVPIGPWPKHRVYREAGRVVQQQFKGGLEGELSGQKC